WWQILPVGPTGYADSPYQSFSSFAGNTNLLSPDRLVEEGLLRPTDIDELRLGDADVIHANVIPAKRQLARRAWKYFTQGNCAALRSEFDEFCARESWLLDFALFLALKDAHGGRPWIDWPTELAMRELGALARAQRDLAESMDLHRFAQ